MIQFINLGSECDLNLGEKTLLSFNKYCLDHFSQVFPYKSSLGVIDVFIRPLVSNMPIETNFIIQHVVFPS